MLSSSIHNSNSNEPCQVIEIPVLPIRRASTQTKDQLLDTKGGDDPEPRVQRQSTILHPDEEMIALDDLVPFANWVYALMVIGLGLSFLLLLNSTISSVKEPKQFVLYVFVLNMTIIYCIQYFAGVLNVFCGLKTAYSRKIIHISLFTLPFIVDALGGQLNEDDTGLAVAWNLWTTQNWVMCMTIPVRNGVNHCLGKVTDVRNAKWKRFLNIPSVVFAAFDRCEDRPNTLKWLQIQIVLSYVFVIILVIANVILEVTSMETLILVPTIITGFGDGLAEPVGRKWGGNYQYETHGCCTEYNYVRSYPGSFMVWLSGFLAVGMHYSEFTTMQFVIGMIVIPIVGIVTEAKAPHTMDNPFIVLFVGFTVMAVAAIPL